MSVEGDELREQLSNLFDKIAYQPSLGSFTDVGRAERFYAPAFRLASRDQGAYARDLMKRVFGETRAKGFADRGVGCVAHVEHPRRGFEIRDGFQIPNDD